MVKYKQYPNGLNLIVCEGGAISCSFSIMVGTGSVNETAKNNGISHYIEHMNFKGSKSYSSFDISNIMDSNGANYNAYTSVETTCFYAQTIVESLESTFSVVSESVFNFWEIIGDEYFGDFISISRDLGLSVQELTRMDNEYRKKGIICVQERDIILEIIDSIINYINERGV